MGKFKEIAIDKMNMKCPTEEGIEDMVRAASKKRHIKAMSKEELEPVYKTLFIMNSMMKKLLRDIGGSYED